jgi:hypothetical protein
MAVGGLIYRLKQIAKLPLQFLSHQYLLLYGGDDGSFIGDVAILDSKIHWLDKLPLLFSMAVEVLIYHC